MEDKARASFAAVSSARYTSGLRIVLILPSAECKFECASRPCDEVELPASVCWPAADFLGETDMVVTVVVAVGGLSSEDLISAAAEVGGSFPVNSRRWIRDFRSSSSSQTVDGALVDVVDSVPSAKLPASGSSSSSCISKDRFKGDGL